MLEPTTGLFDPRAAVGLNNPTENQLPFSNNWIN